MINELSISEKRVIFNILSLIMKADNILNSAEINFLDSVFEKFQLDISEFDHMDDLSFDDLFKEYSSFSPDKRNYANMLFVQMAECDGYVDPRELAVIQKFSQCIQ